MAYTLNPLTGKFDIFKPDNFSFNNIPEGSFVKIPENQQMIVNKELTNNGELVVDGDLVLFEVVDIQNPLYFINSLNDFPSAVGGVITLLPNSTYFLNGTIDLLGARIVASQNTAIIGGSSENTFLISTGLIGQALITSEWSLPMRNISITAEIAVSLNAGTKPLQALDWSGVNFINVGNVGTVANYTNATFFSCAFLMSAGLKFDGTIGTIAFSQCFFMGIANESVLQILDTATVARRFRIIYSSFVLDADMTGVSITDTPTIPVESYILDNVNFSGAGTYISGLDDSSNKTLFTRCVGITNTTVNGQLFMLNNAVATTVAAINTFYKVAGTTTPSTDNKKYIHTDNRLTNDAIIERRYLIQCSLSFNSGNNNVCEFGFFDSKLGAIRSPSRTKATANASGRAESVTFACIVNHSQGNYLEIHAANTSSVTDITVTDMNFIISEV